MVLIQIGHRVLWSKESFGFALLTSLAIVAGCSTAFHLLYQRFPQLYDVSLESLGKKDRIIQNPETKLYECSKVSKSIINSNCITSYDDLLLNEPTKCGRPKWYPIGFQAERCITTAHCAHWHLWMGQNQFQFEVRLVETWHLICAPKLKGWMRWWTTWAWTRPCCWNSLTLEWRSSAFPGRGRPMFFFDSNFQIWGFYSVLLKLYLCFTMGLATLSMVQAMFGIGVPAMLILAPLHSTATHDDDLLSWISA